MCNSVLETTQHYLLPPRGVARLFRNFFSHNNLRKRSPMNLPTNQPKLPIDCGDRPATESDRGHSPRTVNPRVS